MSRKIKLDAEMGVQVLEFLGQYQQMPERGIVAGQSVASAIDAVFGSHAPVINDIDIFRKVRVDKEIGCSKVNHTAGRHSLSVMDLVEENDGYQGMSHVLRMIDTYSIQSVSRKDLLNFVNCTTQTVDQPLTASKVLAGFDLNCVRVAVDLDTKKLIWDRHFERFIATRQLEVSMLHTPNHTMVRFLRKLQTIPGVFGDIATAAEICAGVSKGKYLGKMIEAKQISVMFGQKMHDQSVEVGGAWAPYFSLETHKFYKDDRSRTSSWKEVDLKEPVPEWSGPGEEVKLWSLGARGDLDVSVQRKLDKLGAAVLTHGPRVVYEARRTKSQSVAVKFGEMRGIFGNRKKSVVGWSLDLFGEGYVEGHAIEDIGHKVDDFMRRHMGFCGLLMGLPMGAQYESIKRIRAIAREFDGEASLGVLETQACAVDLERDDLMREVLRLDAIESKKPFNVVPMQLARLPHAFRNYEVRELLTKGDLMREGSQNRHCVGGYTSVVKSNTSRILSIRPKHGRDKTKWSTVELRDQGYKHGNGTAFGHKANLVVTQHEGYTRLKPDDVNLALVEYLIAMHGKQGLMAYVMRKSFRTGTLESMAKTVKTARSVVGSVYETASRLSKRLQSAALTLDRMSNAARDSETTDGRTRP